MTTAFWALIVMAGFAELGYVTLNISAMPVYLNKTLGMQTSFVTLVGSVFLLTEAVGRAPMGMLSDIIGRRRLLIWGPFITIWTALATLFVHHPLAFVLLRALDGIGAAMLWPAAFAAISDCVPEKDRSSAMSFLNFTYMFGLALGPLVDGLVTQAFGAKQASFYLVAGLFAIATLINALFYPKDHPATKSSSDSETEHPPNATGFDWRGLWQAARELPGYMWLAFVVFFGVGLVMLLVKLFAIDEFKMTETAFGAALLFPAILMAVLAVPMGRWADMMGRVRAVRLGLSAGAAAMWLIASQANPFLVVGAAGICAIGFLLAIPAWLAELSEVNPAKRGVILGAAGTAQGIGSILGAQLGGFLYQNVPLNLGFIQYESHRTPFFGCALMLSLGALLSWWVIHPRAPKKP